MSITTKAICWILPFLTFTSQAEPLYWHATNGKVNLTIFGSVHVGDPSMYPLPQPIYDALKKSDGLIIESDITKSEGVTYPQNKLTAEQVLSEEQLFMLDKITGELGQNAEQFHQLPPWSAALSLQFLQLNKLGYVAEDGVDVRLMQRAKRDSIPLVPLETMQFQINLLANQPEDGKELLTSILEDWENNEAMTQCMITSWKTGDKTNLEKMMQLTEMSPEIEQALVKQRNQDWAQKLSSGTFLPNPSGQYVMIVGALHLIGNNSVIEQLKAHGFNITQLNRSQKAGCQFY